MSRALYKMHEQTWVWAKTNVVLMFGSNLLVNSYPSPWTLAILISHTRDHSDSLNPKPISYLPQALYAWKKDFTIQLFTPNYRKGKKNQLSTSWITFNYRKEKDRSSRPRHKVPGLTYWIWPAEHIFGNLQILLARSAPSESYSQKPISHHSCTC